MSRRQETISSLFELGSESITEPYQLQTLFHLYCDLSDAKDGFKFSIARRLVSLSLAKEGPAITRKRFNRIRAELPQKRAILRFLDEWISLPSSHPRYVNLVLTEERFKIHFSRAMDLVAPRGRRGKGKFMKMKMDPALVSFVTTLFFSL